MLKTWSQETHTQSPHIPHIYTCQCDCPHRSQRNLEYLQGHSSSGHILLFLWGWAGWKPTCYHTVHAHIHLCIYSCISTQASTPLIWKMTGLLLPMTCRDWFLTACWRCCLPWDRPRRCLDKVLILWEAFIWAPCVSLCSSGLLQVGWWPMSGLPGSSLARDYLGFLSYHCLSVPLWVCR